MTDRLKQTWQDTRFRQPDQNHISEILKGKRSTALQNLARRYRRFSLICGACIITSLSFLNIRFIPEADRLLLSGAFALYFFIASMMDLWLSNGIAKIDCLRMSVIEVARKAFFLSKTPFHIHGNTDSDGDNALHTHRPDAYRRLADTRMYGHRRPDRSCYGDSRVLPIHGGLSRYHHYLIL